VLLPRFAVDWPQVDIQLTESAHDAELLPLVERGELDLTFAMLPLPASPFEAAELLCDPYVLVVAADSPLVVRREAPGMREIAGLPLIGFRQCRSVTQVESHLRASGIEPHFVFRSDDNGTIQALVAAGMGVALVPLLTVEPGDGRIAVLSVADDVPQRHLAPVWHRDRYRSPASRALVEATQEICVALEQSFSTATSRSQGKRAWDGRGT